MVRELLAAYRDHEDLISIGAYRRGGNRMVDLALEMLDPIAQFLRQKVDEQCTVEEAQDALLSVWRVAQERIETLAAGIGSAP